MSYHSHCSTEDEFIELEELWEKNCSAPVSVSRSYRHKYNPAILLQKGIKYCNALPISLFLRERKCLLSTSPRQNRVTLQQRNSLGRILNNVECCTWMKIWGGARGEARINDEWECSEKRITLTVTRSVSEENLLLWRYLGVWTKNKLNLTRFTSYRTVNTLRLILQNLIS